MIKDKGFNPTENYNKTKDTIGYVPIGEATQETYDRIGFMSGLEVHQQLLTKRKLFCNCPAGIYQKSDEYDAEIIRHMRPTLSELGEYDGTALMEFKTRKKIVYHISNNSACTYDIDDTPPFPIDREALEIAIRISLLSKLSIVGEVHITRKQYLDGSIPTGFQRTGIIGIEGEIYLKNKKVRLIQLSLEEDSCREVSDIGHTRVYRTDRLGMPLIETVTYPDFVNPDEVKEGCDYIRFLNRSTGLVRTGIGAGRQDVNVSCRGGSRVEIKGVAHTKWIPKLTHNEVFRQWALLHIRESLNDKVKDKKKWKISHKLINGNSIQFSHKPLKKAKSNGFVVVAVNLPGFKGILSHFTQPGKSFTDEIGDRMKVVACLQKPFMVTSEDIKLKLKKKEIKNVAEILKAGEDDAQLVFWASKDDVKTALETIEERCLMAFDGVPEETRKSFENGTTIFERVLPGADRMYPDTDTVPIPLENEDIERLKQGLPEEVINRYKQLRKWEIPEDTYTYIFSKNLYPLIEKIVTELKINPVFCGTYIGHRLKFIEGHFKHVKEFNYKIIYALFKYLLNNKIELELARYMLPVVYEFPKMDFDSVLESIKFRKIPKDEIISRISFLRNKFAEVRLSDKPENEANWIMGQLCKTAVGNIKLSELSKLVEAGN